MESPTNETPQQNTPPVEQPAVNTQPVAPATPYVENPGQTLGIVGIITNVMGIGIAGIILGVLSRNKSREAGAATTLGTVSLVWGIVNTVLGVLAFIGFLLFFVFAASTYSEVESAAQASQAANDAKYETTAPTEDELFAN